MTETIPAVLTDEAASPHHASMGRVTPGCEVDVQDSAGASVKPGLVGEVVVGGEPGITLFAGYLDAPEITAASLRDGWFLTGDRAVRDDTGRHFFDGRRSDVLKVSGENVSIVEVESTLAEHPAVLEAAVVGRPDDIRDEVPVAFVVAVEASAPPSLAELDAWCEQRLGQAQAPGEHHPDRRTASHQRRQDPQIPVDRTSSSPASLVGHAASVAGESLQGAVQQAAGCLDLPAVADERMGVFSPHPGSLPESIAVSQAGADQALLAALGPVGLGCHRTEGNPGVSDGGTVICQFQRHGN